MQFRALRPPEQERSKSPAVAVLNCGIDQRANLECNKPAAVMVAELNGETERLAGRKKVEVEF